MAHNVTERDGLFTVREPSWHGLESKVFEDYPTRAEAQAIAHPWEPVTEPLYRRIPVIHTHSEDCYDGDGFQEPFTLVCRKPELSETFEEVDGFVANVRSDTGHTLGVVSSTYEPIKNDLMYDIAEAIEGEAKGSVMYETGGSLKGGAKVWLLIRLRDPLVIEGDPHGGVIPYYALQNAHDGSGAFRGQATMTRIVCDNTAQMADLDAKQRGTEFVFHHTKNVHDRIEEARAALAGWRDSIRNYRLMMEHIIDFETTPQQRNEFIERFIPMPLKGTVSERVESNVEKARETFRDILYGETQQGIEHTAYGLVAASIEYLNHGRRAHTQETRFKRNYLDRNQIVTDAVNITRELVGF